MFEGPGQRVALIQRSCGYSLRPTLTIADLAKTVQVVKAADPECLVLVDNCYGEFTEQQEPGQVRVMTDKPCRPQGTATTMLLSISWEGNAVGSVTFAKRQAYLWSLRLHSVYGRAFGHLMEVYSSILPSPPA